MQNHIENFEIPDYLLAADSAIALQYDGINTPKISAKGEDEIAQEIIRIAIEHQVPIYDNPELNSWLQQLSIDDEIPKELYIAIAEVLAFAYQLNNKTPS